MSFSAGDELDNTVRNITSKSVTLILTEVEQFGPRVLHTQCILSSEYQWSASMSVRLTSNIYQYRVFEEVTEILAATSW